MDSLIDYSGIYPNFNNTNNNNFIELLYYSAYYWKTMYYELLQKYESLSSYQNDLSNQNQISEKDFHYSYDKGTDNIIISQLQNKNKKLVETIMEKNMELSQLYKVIGKQKIPISPVPIIQKPPIIDLCMNPIYNNAKIFSIDPSQQENIILPPYLHNNPPENLDIPDIVDRHINHGQHKNHHYHHHRYNYHNDLYYPPYRYYPYPHGYYPYPPYYLYNRNIENPNIENNE